MTGGNTNHYTTADLADRKELQEYVWNMSGLCLDYVWNTPGIRMDYVWIMYGICMEYVRNICAEFLRNTYGIRMEHVWPPGIEPGSSA